MKFITILSLTFLIIAPALAMDPSSLPLSSVRPQEVSSYAGQDSERKQEHAELDTQQFEREQESKKQRATIAQNIVAVQSMNGQRDQEIERIFNLVLPRGVQRIISEYDKQGFENGHELMYALLPSTPYEFSNQEFRYIVNLGDSFQDRFIKKFRIVGTKINTNLRIDFDYDAQKNDGTQRSSHGFYYVPLHMLRNAERNKLYWVNNENVQPFELSGEIIDGKLHLIPDKRGIDTIDLTELITQCTEEQLQFIRDLGVQASNHSNYIELSEERTQMFNALPLQIRATLESNFSILHMRPRRSACSHLRDGLETVKDFVGALFNAIKG